MLHRLVISVPLIVLLWTLPSWGSKVYVEDVRGISVADADVATVTELIKTSLIEDMGHSLTSTYDEADYSVSGRLMKFGDAYSLTLIKAKGSSEVFRSSLKAAQMSDMDVVVKRLVRAVSEEHAADSNASVKDVTLHEEKDYRRRKEVLSQFTFGVGPAATSNMNIEGQTILWNIGYNYELDFDWDMHLDVDWLSTLKHSENDAYFYGLNFGINYYLTTNNASPFIEGHFGYGTASASTGCSGSSLICSSKDRASGWMLGTGIGFRFFRTSKSNFSFILRGSVLTAETEITKERPAVGSLMIVGYFH